jgi:site-specific DNA recombinase
MIPCALYLRYSSDRQNERSPEDQEAVCRPYMERAGFSVAAVYVDRAKSGASVLERTDFQRMLADAKTGLFKAVCAETTSRYGRDEEDRAAARKRLTFAGVTIMTPADGVVTRVVDGIKAVMDAHQLEDLKRMVWRGMSAVVRDGRHAGGAIYGYRSVPKLPDEPRGELEVVSDQAEIVRRVFREYIAGATPRAIAAALNNENLPPPRGTYWRASTINGHTKRKTGILQNEIYCGRLIWNRCYRVRDPDTGQRIWRYRPEGEWQRSQAEHLRLVDDATFEEAQRLRGKRARASGGFYARPKRILSGLLRCGTCGAGMSKKDVDHGRPRIVCTRMIEARTCENRRRYYLDEIEGLVVGGLRDELGSPEAISYFVQCYNEERRRKAAGRRDGREAMEAQIVAIDRQIDRAVRAIIDGRITEAEAEAHLPELRARHVAISAQLNDLGLPPAAIALRPAAVDTYLRDLSRLDEAMNADLADGFSQAAKTLRSMIETVTIVSSPAGTPPGVIVRGDLSFLIGGAVSVGGNAGAG